MFGVMLAAAGTAPGQLEPVAREFSPRIEPHGPREMVLDLSGLTRLLGDAHTIAAELRRTAADRGLQIRVAIAGTRMAARLLVQHRAGITVVPPGEEAAQLAPLPLMRLAAVADAIDFDTLRRWGVRTLGDFVALPPDDVAARLGRAGVAWQRLARGEDPCPLVAAVPEERFEQALDLEWPIEGLEPLSFVLGRLMTPLAAQLERRDRGAAVLHVRLHLVTREVYARRLELPAPMRDPQTLRTLVLLDLESHPPAAAIDRVVVAVDPTPGRVLQFSLLAKPLPTPEQTSTLMARLQALMGEGRCGAPALVDSWQPGAFAMTPFVPTELPPGALPESVETGGTDRRSLALRRFRFPVPARVQMAGHAPASVFTDRCGVTGGAVRTCAGPWRTSGGWWEGEEAGRPSGHASQSWDRDEWDVTLGDGATYRIFRERATGGWFLEGIVD